MPTRLQSRTGCEIDIPTFIDSAGSPKTSSTLRASPSTEETSQPPSTVPDYFQLFPVHPGERYVTYQMWDLYPDWHKDAACLGSEDKLFFGASEPDIRPPYNLGDIK